MNLVVYLRALIFILYLGLLAHAGGVLPIGFTNIIGYSVLLAWPPALMVMASKIQEDDLKNPSLQTLDKLRSVLLLAPHYHHEPGRVPPRPHLHSLPRPPRPRRWRPPHRLHKYHRLLRPLGLASGLEPLCSQSFNSKNLDLDVGSLQSELKQILMLVALGIVDDDDDIEMKNHL